ncbi:MAG: methyltransferase domain-containing protein [Elusimicrobiota bacterium]|jgi:ubiquinone/menaquinone biosynthesis C-methylase UbiE
MTDRPAIEFFDRQAPSWDALDHGQALRLLPDILERAGIGPGDRVLDVGAGTGILVPFLEAAGAAGMAAVDVSPGMAKEYRRKFPGRRFEVADFGQDRLPFPPDGFTKVLVFNSFPHFREPEAVFREAFTLLEPGGRLVICHSMDRAALNALHRGAGRDVERDVLIPDAAITALFRGAGFIRVVVDDGEYFYSAGDKSASPRFSF